MTILILYSLVSVRSAMICNNFAVDCETYGCLPPAPPNEACRDPFTTTCYCHSGWKDSGTPDNDCDDGYDTCSCDTKPATTKADTSASTTFPPDETQATEGPQTTETTIIDETSVICEIEEFKDAKLKDTKKEYLKELCCLCLCEQCATAADIENLIDGYTNSDDKIINLIHGFLDKCKSEFGVCDIAKVRSKVDGDFECSCNEFECVEVVPNNGNVLNAVISGLLIVFMIIYTQEVDNGIYKLLN